VNGLHGLYASWGGFAPHGQKGFTVYRPEHWAFAGTGLYYADILGDSARIFAYEVDGLDYMFRQGLPYPVPVRASRRRSRSSLWRRPCPPRTKRMAKASGTMCEAATMRDWRSAPPARSPPETLARYKYGSGMMVHMTRGKGEVLTAATCEWVTGLKRGDRFTQKITRNVLDRFTSGCWSGSGRGRRLRSNVCVDVVERVHKRFD
jgi:hypothetical protein